MIGTVTKKKANAFWVNANGKTTVCTAQKKLKENGTVVYLSLPVCELEKRLVNIKTRGVAMKKGETIVLNNN